jgi:protein-tyrosine phosphatase
MPPVTIDLRLADDSRDIVHRAVQALAEGKLVAFPTETVYGVAASALNPEAVARLREAGGAQGAAPLALAIKSADDALDYAPNLSAVGMRLARRCWPGPVVLEVKSVPKDSLMRQLPTAVQGAVAPEGDVALCVPAHQTIHDVLRMLAGPLVLRSTGHNGQANSLTAQEVTAALGDDVQLVLDDGRSRYGQPPSVVRLDGNQFEVVRCGVVSQQTIKRLASLMIVFVCTGNTCRSPMAEAICRKLFAERRGCKIDELEDRGVVVASAGIAAMMGGMPAAEAVEVMSSVYGVNVSDHEAQPVTAQLVRHADYILTMTRSHRQALLQEWPEAAARTFQLCHNRTDVSDPIGSPVESYRRCAEQIRAELETWLPIIDG